MKQCKSNTHFIIIHTVCLQPLHSLFYLCAQISDVREKTRPIVFNPRVRQQWLKHNDPATQIQASVDSTTWITESIMS